LKYSGPSFRRESKNSYITIANYYPFIALPMAENGRCQGKTPLPGQLREDPVLPP